MHTVGWGRGVVDAWAARTVEVERSIAAVGAAAVAGGIAVAAAIVVAGGVAVVVVAAAVVAVVVAGGRAFVEHFGASTVLGGTVVLRYNSLGWEDVYCCNGL